LAGHGCDADHIIEVIKATASAVWSTSSSRPASPAANLIERFFLQAQALQAHLGLLRQTGAQRPPNLPFSA